MKSVKKLIKQSNHWITMVYWNDVLFAEKQVIGKNTCIMEILLGIYGSTVCLLNIQWLLSTIWNLAGSNLNFIIAFYIKIILVDTLYGYPKTNPWYKDLRINTWLSCRSNCWTSTGAQNVYLNDNADRFAIFIQQDTLTTKLAAKFDFVLHYEVEFPCPK